MLEDKNVGFEQIIKLIFYFLECSNHFLSVCIVSPLENIHKQPLSVRICIQTLPLYKALSILIDPHLYVTQLERKSVAVG